MLQYKSQRSLHKGKNNISEIYHHSKELSFIT